MQNNTTIGFIGAGNMAYALISGLLNNKIKASDIKLSDIDKRLLSKRSNEFGVEVFTNNTKLAIKCNVIVLAVKPQVLSIVCKALKSKLKHKPLIISIAAGVKIDDINRWLGGNNCVVRAMPNTPALFGKGATAMFANTVVDSKQKTLSKQIFSAVGSCLWVKNENMLNVVTALSGSGPAYFFLLIESMTNAGIALGLNKTDAQQLSVQTALGASIMASNSSDCAYQLRAKVTSKNGTTQAAIDCLQNQNFEMIITKAMRMAVTRSIEIGSELSND